MKPEEVVEEEIVEEEVEEVNPSNPYTHTVLEVWQNLLSNIDTERALDITPQASIALLASWPHLRVKEHDPYSHLYYSYLHEMKTILDTVIEENPKALKRIENDAEDNHDLYVEVIGRWQEAAMQWEEDWDSSLDTAHISLAAIADAINFALSSKGLVAHLDSIGFQLTDADMVRMQTEFSEEK